MNVANNQEIDVPNIGKSSPLEVCKSSGSVETPNNILTTENREEDKIDKISDKKTKAKKKKTFTLGDTTAKNTEGWGLNRSWKSSVFVKSISGTTTNGTSYHIKGCLIDCSLEIIILHYGTNYLSCSASADDIASRTVALGRSAKTEYN